MRKNHTHPKASAVAQYTTAPVQPGKEWLRPSDVRSMFGISRSLLYELIGENKVRSVSLRREGRQKGVRLISVESLRAYIIGHEGKAD